jgi:hypothetical protein
MIVFLSLPAHAILTQRMIVDVTVMTANVTVTIVNATVMIADMTHVDAIVMIASATAMIVSVIVMIADVIVMIVDAIATTAVVIVMIAVMSDESQFRYNRIPKYRLTFRNRWQQGNISSTYNKKGDRDLIRYSNSILTTPFPIELD